MTLQMNHVGDSALLCPFVSRVRIYLFPSPLFVNLSPHFCFSLSPVFFPVRLLPYPILASLLFLAPGRMDKGVSRLTYYVSRNTLSA